MHCLVVLVALSSLLTPQQKQLSVPGPPDLIVSKTSWNKFHLPVGGDRDPFAPNDMIREEARAKREAEIQNRQRIASGEPLVKAPVYQIHTSSLNDLKPGVAAYSYTIKIKNSGSKTIRSVEWAYVFTDSTTGEEVGRTVFRHSVKISPGKEGEVIGYTQNPPTRVIDARRAASEVRLKETIEFYRVRYEDDSLWERPE